MTDPTDKELSLFIRKAAHGNEAAFEKLVLAFEKPVYNYLLRLTGNREDAEDAAQETFLRLWRSSGGFRGECPPGVWIMRIARNCAYDILRRRAPVAPLTDDDGETVDIPDSDEFSSPPAAYCRQETAHEVRAAIDSLKLSYREVIVLRDINGRRYDEISQLLGIDEGTVKSRLHRARLALKEILKKRNFY